MHCPFCALASRDDGTHRVRLRSQSFVVFDDRRPRHATHLIVAPRVHAETYEELRVAYPDVAARLLPYAAEVAARLGLRGYKVVLSVGRGGGQRVMHSHAHLFSDQTGGV